MNLILIALLSYLLGAIPSAYIIGKFKHVDITSEGSGNIGGTNAYRVLGARLGILVALMDVGKVILALNLTRWYLGVDTTDLSTAISALAAVLGHNWSIYVGFRGGKGIAVSVGSYVYLFPGLGLVAIGVAVVNILITKYVSLGSLNFVLAMAVFLWVVPETSLEFRVMGLLLLAIATFRHRANLVRLRNGTERRFGEPKD